MDPDEIELLSELYPELDIGEIRTLLGISGRQRLSSLKTEKVEEVGIIIISSDSSSDSGDFSSEISESETQDLDIPQKSPIDRQRESSEHGKSSEELKKLPSSSLKQQRKLVSLENFNSDLFSADFSNSDESGSSQDESDSVDREEVLPPIHHPVTEKPQRSRPRADRSETAWPIGRCHSDPQLSGDTEFLKSLSPLIPEYRRHPDANVYLQQFKKNRLGLVDRLYLIYNRKVFDTKLPADFQITWNPRLTKTAGLCYYKTITNIDVSTRVARIELSEKVCDNAERVRDTLLHELCHVAVWLINGVRGSHGRVWKMWARKANRTFPELPQVRRCHSYEIAAKYIYRCKTCGQEIKRHSKSLDVEKKVCGLCRGRFELLVSGKVTGATPKTPAPLNRFAAFVQQNYSEVKSQSKLSSHKEVMEALSKNFSMLKTHLEF